MGNVQAFTFTDEPLRVWNGHAFKPNGRFAWLQRLLWRLLLRFGAVKTAWADASKVKRVLLDGDKIVEEVFKARMGMDYLNRKPTQILIGPHTLSEMLCDPAIRDICSPLELTGRAGFDRNIYGLPIRVVPQMEGFVVLD